MRKFKSHTGLPVALYRANIDTDQIIPKQFLTRIERTGFGEFLFHDWRYNSDGSPTNEFVLNDPRYHAASILLTGANFGCGSSREHAPWALQQYGFEVIIAPGFAEIFYSNCLKIGLLPISLSEQNVGVLAARSLGRAGYRITADLDQQLVFDDDGFEAVFRIDEFRRYCLMNGLDEIGLTLQYEEQIARFEQNSGVFLPSS